MVGNVFIFYIIDKYFLDEYTYFFSFINFYENQASKRFPASYMRRGQM